MTSIMAPLGGNIADRIGCAHPGHDWLLVQGAALFGSRRLLRAMPYWQIALGLGLMGLGGGLFYPPNTSAAMNAAPKNRLGIASGTLATLRQAGMVTSFALSLAVAASSLPRAVMMQLFVGNNVALGSAPMKAFVTGMHSAFLFQRSWFLSPPASHSCAARKTAANLPRNMQLLQSANNIYPLTHNHPAAWRDDSFSAGLVVHL
jgi:hypothetical protein